MDPQHQPEENCEGNKGGKRSVYSKVKAKTDLKGRKGQQKFPLHDQAGSSTVLLSAPSPGNAPMKCYSQVTISEK